MKRAVKYPPHLLLTVYRRVAYAYVNGARPEEPEGFTLRLSTKEEGRMQYTPRTPDHVIDTLYAMPCQLCGGGGEIGVEDMYGRMEPSNSPYADDRPCYACDGTGIETRPWIINGEDGNIA